MTLRINDLSFKIILKILFSNKSIYTGLFIFSIGILFLLVFVPATDFKNHLYENEKYETIKGTINSTNETNSTFNNEKIFKYNYTFEINNNKYESHSYGIYRTIARNQEYEIEYIVNNPNISRIKGTKNGAFPIEMIWLSILPFIIGTTILSFIVFNKLMLIKVLKTNFELINCRLEEIKKVPFVRINNFDSLYRFVFSYRKNNQEFTLSKYYTDDNKFKILKIYILIINPEKPNQSFLYDSLNESIKIYLKEKVLWLTRGVANVG
jgi:hypothetical protein